MSEDGAIEPREGAASCVGGFDSAGYAAGRSGAEPPAPLPVDAAAEEAAAVEETLMGAALDLTAQLDLEDLLTHLVERARRLTGARFAALGVLDGRGQTTTFVHAGLGDETARALPHPPRGHGVFALIPPEGPLILDDLREHPDFGGFPPGHPPMTEFLGLAVRVRSRIFGRLYLTDKEGGFTQDDAEAMTLLARAAAVAIENARLYGAARTRERWLAASQDITTMLLEGTEEEDALAEIAARVRHVAEADTSLIILPSVGETWAGEFTDGYRAEELLGTVFPAEGRAMTVLRGGVGVMVDDLGRSPVMRVDALREFGPALYAPMMLRGTGTGVLLVLRTSGSPEFQDADLLMAESLAAQAALALELAQARHAEDVASLLDERARIGRDLHDLAIQQLFATGMELEGVRTRIAGGGPELAPYERALERALKSVDDSVTQIRAIVHGLREADTTVALVERLRREASLARTSLGFAPSLVVMVDDTIVDDDHEDGLEDVIAARLGPDIADDVTAVVREGLSNAARHARASSVQVGVSVSGVSYEGLVQVHVVDDGVGIDPDNSRHSGTANLAARARRHGGVFRLRPGASGRGTELTWTVPLA